jgi:hypothetical protein
MPRNTGSDNVAVGKYVLAENEAGTGNTASGFFALLHNKGGNDNTATGTAADYRCGNSGGAACTENTEVGGNALRNNEIGAHNAAFGFDALEWGEGISGSEDIGIGYKAGDATAGGTSNVDIANTGEKAESNTTRVGTEGAQTRAFVAGVFPAKVTGCPVQANSSGQLGCGAEPPARIKICVPEKGGKPITTPPCKKAYKEIEI